MKPLPEILRGSGILGPWDKYPAGSKERAKALGVHLLAVSKSKQTTDKAWNNLLAILEENRVWEPLGLASLDDYSRAVTGQTVQQLEERRRGIPGGLPGPGRGKKTADNVSRFSHGNQGSYTLARLERDRPELAAKVRTGKLSANAAAIEAGFRIKTFSVPLHVERAAAALKRVFTNSQLVRLRSLL